MTPTSKAQDMAELNGILFAKAERFLEGDDCQDTASHVIHTLKGTMIAEAELSEMDHSRDGERYLTCARLLTTYVGLLEAFPDFRERETTVLDMEMCLSGSLSVGLYIEREKKRLRKS